MCVLSLRCVAPVRERGLKSKRDCTLGGNLVCCRSREGAWIEILTGDMTNKLPDVAPVRERGLKYHIIANFNTTGMSLP